MRVVVILTLLALILSLFESEAQIMSLEPTNPQMNRVAWYVKRHMDAVTDLKKKYYYGPLSGEYFSAMEANETMPEVLDNLEDTLAQVSLTLERLHSRLRPYTLQYGKQSVNSLMTYLYSRQDQIASTAVHFDGARSMAGYGFWYSHDDKLFNVRTGGLYLILLKVTTVSLTDPVALKVLRNDVPVGYLKGGGQTVTNMYLLDLLQGDKIKVVFESDGGALERGYETVFMGFSISA
ncbi:uncharacterized protein LOC106013150 [Aplysia californica]|uniref:Uncharacterized protein LOC106013150 n=1 Tax=Aplysia californica TaxID=6500 RepID=A0ABM1A9T7_APLCA|nr:uncharacterized protein LOC106013150 [Aplysia californica]